MTREVEKPDFEFQLTNETIHTSSLLIQHIFKGYRDKQLSLAGSVAFTNKSDGSVVTELDKEIEDAVHDTLLRDFPGIPVFGEETGYEDDPAKTFWLIDPIDGTKSFISGEPTFTNMAALIHNGETVASIIYNPSHDDTFTAFKNEGAYKNGIRLTMSDMTPPPIVYCKEQLFTALNSIIKDEQITYQSPPSGGGNGFTLVAEGAIAARFQLWASGGAHDYAPGALLVAEAGGLNIPIKDDSYSYKTNSFITCHRSMAKAFENTIEQIRLLEK